MELLFDILSWICLLIGSFFAVVGGIGILRLPDFFTRLHGGGITDTMAAGMIMLGLMLQSIKTALGGELVLDWLVTVKLIMILFFLLITSPTSCHTLAQAALTHDVQPQGVDTDDAVELEDEPSP